MRYLWGGGGCGTTLGVMRDGCLLSVSTTLARLSVNESLWIRKKTEVG